MLISKVTCREFAPNIPKAPPLVLLEFILLLSKRTLSIVIFVGPLKYIAAPTAWLLPFPVFIVFFIMESVIDRVILFVLEDIALYVGVEEFT